MLGEQSVGTSQLIVPWDTLPTLIVIVSDLWEDTLSMRAEYSERIASALLIIYVIGKVFADNGDVGISIIAPPYGSQLGFSAHMFELEKKFATSQETKHPSNWVKNRKFPQDSACLA
ncbi:hypothetical protein ACTXT7_008718 [Hymenolepis weldensis]